MSMTLASKGREEATYILRKLVVVYGGELLQNHQWPWEFARWKELVFTLLTRIADLPEQELRLLTNHMEATGLLDIEALANLAKESGGSEIGHHLHGRRIVELLQEGGFSQDQSRRGLITMCEIAFVLQDQYDGKIQKYLRHYGELMLKDLDGIFKFSALSKAEVASAFTYWLQNVLGMPLSLVDKDVQKFCEEHKIESDDLIAAADDLALNLGFIDDLTHLYNARLRR